MGLLNWLFSRKKAFFDKGIFESNISLKKRKDCVVYKNWGWSWGSPT